MASDLDLRKSALADGDLRRFVELTLAFHRSFVEVGDNNEVMLEFMTVSPIVSGICSSASAGAASWPAARTSSLSTRTRTALSRRCVLTSAT
ncbi:hypothetical protein [Streptomyces sp. NPDC048436]|uniref:hypothetical protein n=1 Tax=Streptomyces sp. NPDC048436 TaxID=3365550 RepID=UPI00370FB43C